MKTETITYTIPEFFLPALINDDYSGLRDGDEEILEAFIKHSLKDAYREVPELKSHHWSYDSNCGAFFTPWHDMSQDIEAADCTEIHLVIFTK